MLCNPRTTQSRGSFDQRQTGLDRGIDSYTCFPSYNYATMASSSPRQEAVSLPFDKAPQLASVPANSRPRNHVRSISIEPRIHAQSVFDRRARDRVGFLSPQEKMELELEREAVLQIQSAQAAKRRPRIMRLTPAFPMTRAAAVSEAAAAASSKKSPSPPSSASSSVITASEEELATPPGSKIPFPSTKGAVSGLPASSSQSALHPASRKALALKANSPGPEVSGLHIDLACIPTPSARDQHGAASTSTLPELVRKKSGEPVKSSLKQYPASAMFNSRSSSDASIPAPILSRAKSVPSTPNVPKAVHFDSNLEHVKIFRVKGRPTAVSREGSPEHTETETEEEREYPFFGRRGFPGGKGPGVKTPSPTATPPGEMEEQLLLRLPNFPSSARLSVDRDIFLERVYLSDDLRSVKGTVQVRNLSFEKWVAVRFTLDQWATVNEVSAEYSESVKDGSADRFVFSIKLNELLNWPRGAGLNDTKTMFLCLRYTVNGNEIWDNNDGANYQLDFRKRQLPIVPALSHPPTGEVASSASANGGTIPRRYTTGGPAPPTSRIIEMGRRSGVHGQRTRGDSVMEQLKRELDRLRSDEEDHDGAIPASGSFLQEVTKRRSPPVSPGGSNQRSASPSVWTARYDFGASLRNPTNGSRTTDAGRAAALDYFSSRPPPSASSPVRSTFVVSAASPTGSSGSTPRVSPNPSPDFQHKFGMLSPGLDNGVVHHQPAALSGASSSSNTLAVPEPSQPSHRFYSFPPNRSTLSPSGGWGADAQDDTGSGDVSPSPPHSQGSVMVKPDGLVLEDYTPDGSQASPTSLTGSPNPFSPAMSVSSIESDTTVGIATGEDKRLSLADSLERLGEISPSRFLRRDDLISRPRPSSFAAGERYSPTPSPSVLSSTHSPSSEIMTPDDLVRPTSLASFNELVARFCWNSDNQLPLDGNELHALGTSSSPTDASGRSTPTATAGAR